MNRAEQSIPFIFLQPSLWVLNSMNFRPNKKQKQKWIFFIPSVCRRRSSIDNVVSSFTQVGLVWQGGNGIDELLRDFEGPNALTALRTRLGRRDSATQFRAVSPPR